MSHRKVICVAILLGIVAAGGATLGLVALMTRRFSLGALGIIIAAVGFALMKYVPEVKDNRQ